MRFNTSGLVIRVLDIGEYDRALTVLTADKGVVRAFCRGVRRVKSKRLSASSLLTYSELTLSENKDGYTLEEALPKEIFFGLRSDVEKLALAQYFCELFYEFASDASESSDMLRLILNSLYLLSEGKKPPLLIKAAAELRLLSATGFMPNLVSCRSCGEFESGTMAFDTADGSLLCGKCPINESCAVIPVSCVQALRHIVFSEFDKLFSFSLPQSDIRLLSKTVERYLLGITGRSFKALDFYNTFL